ncbi:DNA-directed RNA polymerases I, II, and III subunit RPABC3 [Sorochytrium milnesiophthora]
MSRSEAYLFSDIFIANTVDKDGKKFDRVSRLTGRSENYDVQVVLDFNNELYPLAVNERFTLSLATTLSLDPTQAAKHESWHEKGAGEARDLSDEYDYVCHGRVYKFEEVADKVAVYVSYGGLLMCLEGEYRHLQSFSKGENVYLLMRK